MSRHAWVWALALLSASASAQQRVEETATPVAPVLGPRPALTAPKATQARLMDITQAGDTLVAVGEEGVILTSTDAQQWKQATVPVNVMI